jgi:hypothetical protein
LAYESQSENPGFRAIRKSQKIRIRFGGTTNLLDPFPDKPPNMRWRTYGRLFNQAEAAQERWITLSREFLRRQNLGSQPVERRSSSQLRILRLRMLHRRFDEEIRRHADG